MKTVLHIGTQKTGSKAIQRFLVDRLASIPAPVVCFPAAGREGTWHRPIYHELRRGETGTLALALEEARDRSADVAVLSYEALYLLSPEAIARVRATVGEARIVLFVRRQDQLVNAMYNQLIKAHRVNFARIERFESELEGLLPDYDHRATIDRWGRAFGHDAVAPVVYDKSRDSVAAFLEQIGIDGRVAAGAEQEANPNPALDAEGLAVLRRVKKLAPHDDDLPRLVNAAHHVLRDRFVDTYRDGDRYVLTLAQRRGILDRYGDANDEVRRRYFPDRPALFPPLEADGPAPAADADAVGIADPHRPVDDAAVAAIYREAGVAFPGAA